MVDGEPVIVRTIADRESLPAESSLRSTGAEERTYDGISTLLTEHSVSLFLDDAEGLDFGSFVEVDIQTLEHDAAVAGAVTGLTQFRGNGGCAVTIEILDFRESGNEYLEILYDRVPTLPQSLDRDFGIIGHLWQNIAHRVARTAK